MILQNLNNFYQLFSRYIASKVTYSHQNIAYLSSYLCLRKFWQCRNSTFRTIQKNLHKPIRLKLDIYIFWPLKSLWHPKQLAKNPKKMCNRLLFQSQRWSHKNWTISTSHSATIKVAGFGCPWLWQHYLLLTVQHILNNLFCILWVQYMCCNLVTYLDILRRMSLTIFTYDLLTVWSHSIILAHCQNIINFKYYTASSITILGVFHPAG